MYVEERRGRLTIVSQHQVGFPFRTSKFEFGFQHAPWRAPPSSGHFLPWPTAAGVEPVSTIHCIVDLVLSVRYGARAAMVSGLAY